VNRSPNFYPCIDIQTTISFALIMSVHVNKRDCGLKGATTEPADFCVAPTGSDQWSGTCCRPTGSGSDGPFATLARARDAVRALQAEAPGRDILVLVRGGTYCLTETLVFGLRDSRVEGRTTRYAAYPGETPVLSSGLSIAGWRRVTETLEGLPQGADGKVWEADLPEALERVLTLYDGTKRLTRSSGPVFQPAPTGEYERVPSQNVAHERDRMLLRRVSFPRGALRDYPNMSDIELRFTPVPWTLNLLPLESVDEEGGEALLAVEATAPVGAKNKWGARVENALDYLNEPGRWAVNTLERKLYFWPEGNAPGGGIVAPCLQELIRVEGGIDYEGPADEPVKGLVFDGLTLMHGERDRTAPGYKGTGIQHDWEMFDKGTALMRFRGAEDCAVEGCRFTSTSGTALRLDLYCQRISIRRNLFDDVGHMGILLCGYGPGTKDANRGNEIVNNLLHHCGQEIWHGHAVFVWQSGDNRIANNRIHHCARKAIGLCGVRIPILQNRDHAFDEAARTIRWHEIDAAICSTGEDFDRFMPFLHTHGNLVENNEIFRVLEKLADGSAINVSGAGEGNTIRANLVHHIRTYDASSAMRVDDWQRGTLFRDNIVYRCNIGAITRKNLNHIENNIFADVNTKGYVRFASYPAESAAPGSRVRRNIFYESGEDAVFYTTSYLVSSGASLPRDCDADCNLFFCAGAPEASRAQLEFLRADGIEKHSLSAAPLFVDAVRGDFRLHPDSPALNLGFESIDMASIGLRDDFPEHLRVFDFLEIEEESSYTRGRDGKRIAYEWW